MAEFYVSLSSNEISYQIAKMLNKYNNWATRFSAMSLSITPAKYFAEIYGPIVVGCASCLQENEELTKLQHICVLPEYRGRRIASKLVNIAINNSITDFIYMTIREDNTASLALARSLGFIYINKHWFRDHWTLTFGRRRDNDSTNKCFCREM